jgi:Reverse transcriptase (RNA-dependent DNA polymerase)
MKSRSVNTAVGSYVTEVLKSLDAKEEVTGVFYDYTKAFDTVNVELLLTKLAKLGIAGNANDWLRSFLVNRKQSVFISRQGEYFQSTETTTSTGLPQGATLSPLLFILFTNNLPSEVTAGKLTLFADDTTHLFSSQSKDVGTEVKKGVLQLESWSISNGLFLNRDKTVLMQFSNKRKKILYSPLIRLDKKSIRVQTETKFLGIIMDYTMNWTSHVESVCAKVASACYLIRKMMNLVNLDTVKLIYFGILQSHLQYGVIVWGGTTQTKRLFVLQKRALRYMARASTDPCADIFYKDSCRKLFINFKVLTMPCLYIYYTILYCLENNYLSHTNESIHNYDTRAKTDVRVESHRLSIYTRDPIYNGSKFYNALPGSIKDLPLMKLKGQLKEYLISNCFYTLDEFLNS